MIKKVLTNTLAQLIAKGFTATTTLTVTLLISRFLGPSGFGDFTKVFVFVGYFYTFVDFGFNSIYVKRANPKNEKELLNSLLALRLILSTVLSLVAITFGQILPYSEIEKTGFNPTVKAAIIIASATIITQALFATANAFFQKRLTYHLSTISAGLGSLMILIWAIFVSKTGPSIISYSAGYVLGGIVSATVALAIIFSITKKAILPNFTRFQLLSLFKESFPIGLALITNLIYFRNDVFILSNTRQSSEVGLYGLAYLFFENSLTLPIFLSNAIFPVLVTNFKDNLTVFKKNLAFYFKLFTLLSVAVSIILYLVAYLIPLYDTRFTGSKDALQILSIGVPFFFLSALLWHLVIIYGRQIHLIYIYGLGALLNLILNLALIPKNGYLAAAATTIISEGFILILLIWLSTKLITRKGNEVDA